MEILQHPPSQAVYQRILKPFPTVAIVGVDSKQAANFFVEVNLLKNKADDGAEYQYVPLNPAHTGNKKDKNLLEGQLVQRSEQGSEGLVVVFRKLKVLTTSAQQGALFVLKFSLKRYVDNILEPVPGVPPIYSTPVEVFSHSSYLKGRPSPSLKESKSSKHLSKFHKNQTC